MSGFALQSGEEMVAIEGAGLLEDFAILMLSTISSSSGTLCQDILFRYGLITKSSQDRDQAESIYAFCLSNSTSVSMGA